MTGAPYRKLNPDADMLRRAVAGDKAAVAATIRAYTPLVRSMANRVGGFGVDADDLTQEGLIGLARAIEKFDLSYSNGFSAYARWWIKSAIDQYLFRNVTMVRVPLQDHRSYGQAVYAVASQKKLDVALDAPIRRGSSMKVADTFAAPDAQAEEIIGERQEAQRRRQALEDMMTVLTPGERRVIGFRWLNDEQMIFRDIGDLLGISPQRVQQLEKSGLRKLGADMRETACR